MYLNIFYLISEFGVRDWNASHHQNEVVWVM